MPRGSIDPEARDQEIVARQELIVPEASATESAVQPELTGPEAGRLIDVARPGNSLRITEWTLVNRKASH